MRLKATDNIKLIIKGLREQSTVANHLYSAMVGDYESECYMDNFPSYIAIDEDIKGQVTYMKSHDLDHDYDPYDNSKRRSTKFGRIIRKIFSEYFYDEYSIIRDSEIEQFTNMFLSNFTDDNEDIRVYHGDQIQWAYHQDNYHEMIRGGSLWRSCMRGEEQTNYFEIYTKNKDICKILVHLKEDKIIGRAILWNFVDVDTGERMKIMDRIYYSRDTDEQKFKVWAKKNHYIHKREQSHQCKLFVDPRSDGHGHFDREFKIPIKFAEHGRYPYLDTFYWLNDDEMFLTNQPNSGEDQMRDIHGCTTERVFDISDRSRLVKKHGEDVIRIQNGDEDEDGECIDGYTHVDNTVISEYENETLLVTMALYSEFMDSFISRGKARFSESMKDVLHPDISVHSMVLGDYFPKDKCVHLPTRGDWTLGVHAVYCLLDKEHMLEEDMTYSKYHGVKINSEASRYVNGDYVHKSHVVYSHFEKKDMISGKSNYILGVGWVSKEQTRKAKRKGLPVQADQLTEYEARKQEMAS